MPDEQGYFFARLMVSSGAQLPERPVAARLTMLKREAAKLLWTYEMACRERHAGCPSLPSQLDHLLRAAKRF
jgi:hypothetical protein